MSTIVNKFIKTKYNEAISSNGEDVTLGRVQSIKNRLQHFKDYFGDRLMSSITEADLQRWSIANGKMSNVKCQTNNTVNISSVKKNKVIQKQ